MHLPTRSVLIGFIIAFASAPAAGADKVYRWVDQDGKVHYSQTAPATAPTSE